LARRITDYLFAALAGHGRHYRHRSRMPDISITELEAAINFWRNRSPSHGDEMTLGFEANALSKPYAQMIVQRRNFIDLTELDKAAIDAWQSFTALSSTREPGDAS
jgi:hypothetical protein